jgi:hypothetical protein
MLEGIIRRARGRCERCGRVVTLSRGLGLSDHVEEPEHDEHGQDDEDEGQR